MHLTDNLNIAQVRHLRQVSANDDLTYPINEDDFHLPEEEKEELINFFNKKIEEKQQALQNIENVFAQMPSYRESRAIMDRLRKSIAVYEKLAELIDSSYKISNPRTDIEAYTDSDLENKPPHIETTESDDTEGERVRPIDLLKPEFRGRDLLEIIYTLLADTSDTLSNNRLTELAFDTNNEFDFKRCRGSISSQARYGAENGRWYKVGRGLFSLIPLDDNTGQLSNDEEDEDSLPQIELRPADEELKSDLTKLIKSNEDAKESDTTS